MGVTQVLIYLCVQAEANSLILPNVPNELCDLKPLELRLVCMRVRFMRLVALPTSKQRCIHATAARHFQYRLGNFFKEF